MELIELSGLLSIDTGAPYPTIISNDNNLHLMFYPRENGTYYDTIKERNGVYDKGVYIVKFIRNLSYKFGSPNNETLSGHPYYKLGLRSNSFYQLDDSDWIKELIRIDSVHPYHNQDKWKLYKHYIFTFHDSMFECISKSFEIQKSTASIYEQASTIVNEMYVKKR